MTLAPDELERRIRETLERLRVGGARQSLAVCRDLVDLGLHARVAWHLVEMVLAEEKP